MSDTQEKTENSLNPLEWIGIITLLIVDSIITANKQIKVLKDSLKYETFQKKLYEAESNYRVHYLVREEGPTKNTEEYRGPCKLYTYKEVMDSFQVVEDRYYKLLWSKNNY